MNRKPFSQRTPILFYLLRAKRIALPENFPLRFEFAPEQQNRRSGVHKAYFHYDKLETQAQCVET